MQQPNEPMRAIFNIEGSKLEIACFLKINLTKRLLIRFRYIYQKACENDIANESYTEQVLSCNL